MTGPINLGDPTELTIKQLAEEILELTGSRSELVFRRCPSDDPLRRCPDITRAREALEWQPCIALRDGLMKTIQYFEAIIRKHTGA